MSHSRGQTIGIEITPTAVRVVGVEGVTFVGCKEVSIASPEEATLALRKALKEAAPKSLQPTRVVTTIPESKIFRRVLELPVLTGKELEEAVNRESKQYLPEDIQSMQLDYQVIERYSQEDTQKVMVVGVPIPVLHSLLEVITAADLNVFAIDVHTSALARAVQKEKEKAYVLVSAEGETTIVSLYRNEAIVHTSIVGGDQAYASAALIDEINHCTAQHDKSMVGVSEVLLAGRGELLEDLAKGCSVPVRLAHPALAVPAFCDQRFLVALGCALYPLNFHQ